MNINHFKTFILFITLFIVINFNSVSKSVVEFSDTLQIKQKFGNFQNASSVSTAREEFIFVSDISLNKVYKYSKEGDLLADFGGTGMGQNELNLPYTIDASNGLDVLIADYNNNRITRLDINLRYILTFDFNIYNNLADINKRIYNPRSLTTLSTGEVFVICDAGNNNAVKISDYSEISLFFGPSNIGIGKLSNPTKIINGIELDVWILDKGSNEILNFNNSGIFLKKLKTQLKSSIISIAIFKEYLFILHSNALLKYNLRENKYSVMYYLQIDRKSVDISILDINNIIILTQINLLKLSLNN